MECLRIPRLQVFVRRRSLLIAGLIVIAMMAPTALMAATTGACNTSPTFCVPVLPGDTAFLAPVPPGTPAGTLMASMDSPFTYTTASGTTHGDVFSAVFQTSGGTLDFYYQVFNAADSAATPVIESDQSFTGFQTNLAFRLDGSTLVSNPCAMGPCGTFTWQDGTVTPDSGFRLATNNNPGDVGFNFPNNPGGPGNGPICKGCYSNVLVISTDATSFGIGTAAILDGGAANVNAFAPAPEPASFALIGGGLLLLAGFRRARSKNRG